MKLRYLAIWILLQFTLIFGQQGYYNEQYRPQFHFSPQAHWMNDPNGLVYFDGNYHLFYQYYPGDIVWGPMHWGHAWSTDLFHWKHLPIALYPDSLGNIFSGSAVIDKNNTAGFGQNAMIAIFTYHNDSLWVKGYKNTESQGIAYSLDEGLTWKKYEGNPVLNNSGEQDFRDPKVFWNDEIGMWNMVLAVGDRIKIFSSNNLKNWNFESDFKPENDLPGLGVWECPDLFKMNVDGKEKWMMIANQGDKAPNGGSGTRYFVGDFDGKVFKNDQPSIWLDYGTDFYAGVTYSNVPDNKRILIAWMSNWQYAQKTPTKVWRNAMTLPRELELDTDAEGYFLRQKMVTGFDSIKTLSKKIDVINLPYTAKDINLSQTEIDFDCNVSNLEIEFSNNIGENLKVQLKDNQLLIDRHNSGQTDFSDKFADKIQVMLLKDSAYKFQIILDRASIELFLNDGKYSMTNIFFPNEKYSNLKISSSESAELKNAAFYKIKRVWK
jgi:fructan beta-fructosidase